LSTAETQRRGEENKKNCKEGAEGAESAEGPDLRGRSHSGDPISKTERDEPVSTGNGYAPEDLFNAATQRRGAENKKSGKEGADLRGRSHSADPISKTERDEPGAHHGLETHSASSAPSAASRFSCFSLCVSASLR
jgi:hypothetical protein